jgi:hypothetical protein
VCVCTCEFDDDATYNRRLVDQHHRSACHGIGSSTINSYFSKHTHHSHKHHTTTTYAVLVDLLTGLALRKRALDVGTRTRRLLLDDAACIAAAAVVADAFAVWRTRILLHEARIGEACAQQESLCLSCVCAC